MDKDFPATDYAAILADMEGKKAALENAIVGLRAALASGALGVAVGDGLALKGAAGSSVANGPAMSLPRGAFLGKKAPEAIKLYLSAMRAKRTNKEIAQGLKEGGMESTGDLDALVTSGLFRLKKDGVLLRFEDGWGLAEWYPESFRNRVTDKAVTVKRKTKKKAGNKKNANKASSVPLATSTVDEPKSGAAQPVGNQATIEQYFASRVGLPVSTRQMAEGLQMRIQTVSLVCAKLAHRGKIEKLSDGTFCLPRAQQMPKAS